MFKCLRVWGTFHLSHHSDDAGFGDGGDGDDDDHDGERCCSHSDSGKNREHG